MQEFVKIHEQDNVAVALRPLLSYWLCKGRYPAGSMDSRPQYSYRVGRSAYLYL